MQSQSKRLEGDSSSGDEDSGSGSEGDEGDYEYENSSKGEEENEDPQVAKQKSLEFLRQVSDMLRLQIVKLDEELETAKTKKVKGGNLKKQKEKQGALAYKTTHAKKLREKIEDVMLMIDQIEATVMRNFKKALGDYMDNPDEQAVQLVAETEVAKILLSIELIKKQQVQMLKD